MNKPIVLKFDAPVEAQHSQEGLARAYVYLENKTFINAHLIKRGLARADASEHRLAQRFRDYQAQVPVIVDAPSC